MATVTAVDVASDVCARVGLDADGAMSSDAKRITREQRQAMTLAINEERVRQAMDALVMSMEAVDEDEDWEAMERDLENRGQEMLRAALQRKAQRKADATAPTCPKSGSRLKALVRRETQVLLRFGPIRISREYGYCPSASNGARRATRRWASMGQIPRRWPNRCNCSGRLCRRGRPRR